MIRLTEEEEDRSNGDGNKGDEEDWKYQVT
jgi:hypothetical protein